MVRPLRRLYPLRGFRRKRHRSWILSMTCATVSLAILGGFVALHRFGISGTPSPWLAGVLTAIFSLPGLLLGLYSMRGGLPWIAYAGMPILANLLLLLLPWILWRS